MASRALELSVRARAPVRIEAEFRVEPGEILALVGPSGAGKTTLLRMIAGLVRPEQGRIMVGGQIWFDSTTRRNLQPWRRRVGFVFQDHALFPHLTARENVSLAMDWPDAAETERLLRLVGLEGLGQRPPSALSGGQRQRVALARALARKPNVLLLDEPFSAVDRPTREALHRELLALRAELEMPVIFVTHDVTEAQALTDSMLVIEAGLQQIWGPTAQVMTNPAALKVLGLRELAALLPARVEERLPEGLTRLSTEAGPVFLPALEAPLGAPVLLRILAHEVILARTRPEGLSAQNILTGRIARIVPGPGPGALVHVALGRHEILARITKRAVADLALSPGMPIYAIVKSLSVGRDRVTAALDDRRAF